MAATPSKYVIACPDACSLHPAKIGADKAEVLLGVKNEGAGGRVFGRKAEAVLGRPVPSSTVDRHLKHYRLAETEQPRDPSVRVPHMEILEEIIQRGFQNSKNWKPSIKDTLDAIKEVRAMTGGSAFEDMLSAMAAAAGGEDDEEDEEDGSTEAIEAVLSPEERPDEADEDLEEPAL